MHSHVYYDSVIIVVLPGELLLQKDECKCGNNSGRFRVKLRKIFIHLHRINIKESGLGEKTGNDTGRHLASRFLHFVFRKFSDPCKQ